MKLTPRDLANPKINQLADQVRNLRTRNRETSKEAQTKLGPVEVTAFVQLGAAAAGVLDSYVSDQAETYTTVTGIGAYIGGFALGSPQAVAFANGLTAGRTRTAVREALTTRKRANKPPPQEEE